MDTNHARRNMPRGGGSIQTGPFGSQLHAADYVPVGIPSIMPQNIGENRVVLEGISRITEEDAKRLKRYLVKPGDIVYSRRGDVERRALITENENGWLCGTGCLRVSFGSIEYVNPRYASFYLGHPAVREWIVRHAIGATMPNLNTSILSSLPFVLPPLPEQRAIADILGSLDEKIELNRRMNQTLEALAQALFKSWFVDFEPVHAKAEGHSPAGMDAETAALFPSAFDGDVPNGWRIDEIGKVVKVLGGSTPSTKEPKYWDGEYHWATPKDLSALKSPILLDTERKITKEGVAQISSGVLPAGTLLMSSRAPVGYLAISEIPVSINQGFIAMVCDGELPNYYVLNWAETNMEAIKGRSNGTTFMEISKSNFRPMSVIVPNKEIVEEFVQQVEPLYQKLVANLKESHTLAALRDALLPRVMSGEIRVKDVI